MASVDWRVASYMIMVVTTSHVPQQLKIADVRGLGTVSNTYHEPKAWTIEDWRRLGYWGLCKTRSTSYEPERLKIADTCI